MLQEQQERIALLSKAPMTKALLSLGIPTMIGMLINALYNLVDAYFVSGLGESQLGAISVIFPLSQLMVGIGLLFGNGAASYLSRLLGRHEFKMADQVCSTALYGSLLVGAVVTVISLMFLKTFLLWLGASVSILPYALAYGEIYLAASVFNLFNVTMNNLMASEGAAKKAMTALVCGALLNIVLDPVLIYGMAWGIVGAAVATVISQMVSTLIYWSYIRQKKSIFHFRCKDCRFTIEILAEIFKIGIPTLIFQLLTGITIAFINRKAEVYGDGVIAVMGTVVRIMTMGSLSVFGFIKGFQPIAGYSYGARDWGRLHQALRLALIYSTIFCVIFGGCMVVLAQPIIAQFIADSGGIRLLGQKALIANGFSFMLFGFYTVYAALFLALGKGKEGFVLSACQKGICFMPIILTLPNIWGINGILYAQPIADLFAAIVTLVMALRLHCELRVKQHEQ